MAEDGKPVYGIGAGAGEGHPLRVELDTQNRKRLVFKGLHSAVPGAAEGDPQAFTQPGHRLVVAAVDRKFPAVQLPQKALSFRGNGVDGISGSPVGFRGGNVLVKTASQDHIQSLMSPADPQDRLSRGKEGFGKGNVIGIPFRRDIYGAVDRLSVVAGMDIPTAAEDQAVIVCGKWGKMGFHGDPAAMGNGILIIRRIGAVEQ